MATDVETDILIVGTGPAGASLACFLASYGIKGVMVGGTSGSITTPRAHITNMAALECLRDIGLEEECQHMATHNESMRHTRWCYSMAGEEFGRIYSWGNDPARAGDYDAASPCSHSDCPQTVLEPILVRHAVRKGFVCRFDTTFISFAQDDGSTIVSTVLDNLTKMEFKIRSKYLFGCDGARSNIVRQLDLPLTKKPGGGLALNILVRADLSKHMANRTGNLHWVHQPDKEWPEYGWGAIVRMVKPWFEWVFITFPFPGHELKVMPSDEDCLRCVKGMIGDDSIKVEIIDISKWAVNEIVADKYSQGNIFCLGDAVHRHPPFNGLGSNTCVQDAFNLAWKIAYVMDGRANASLLDSYNDERQPVGLSVITRANQGLRDHIPVWEQLGMMEPNLEKRRKIYEGLNADTPEGAERRKDFREAIRGTRREFHGVGIEMNQRYESSAIYIKDEDPRPPLPEDPVLNHEITTYPGSRLPHAWLNTRIPGTQFSTIDLAGHGRFCLLTGHGGQNWRAWADQVAKQLSVEIVHYTIGWRQDYEDVYSDWARRREIADDGCVLARPDRFVAWRCQNLASGSLDKLLLVMKHILDALSISRIVQNIDSFTTAMTRTATSGPTHYPTLPLHLPIFWIPKPDSIHIETNGRDRSPAQIT